MSVCESAHLHKRVFGERLDTLSEHFRTKDSIPCNPYGLWPRISMALQDTSTLVTGPRSLMTNTTSVAAPVGALTARLRK